MTPWHIALPALEKVIQRHFPDVKGGDCCTFAKEIYNGSAAADSLQWIERNDRKPAKDIEHLKSAAHELRQASEKLQMIGWHGAGALSDLASKVVAMNHGVQIRTAVSRQDALEIISDFIEGLATEIQTAATEIDLEAGSAFSVWFENLDQKPVQGRPFETAAYYAAREAYEAFASLSGNRPTVISDRVTGKDGGPFLDFLTEIFNALGLTQSAQANARKVCMEKTLKKT